MIEIERHGEVAVVRMAHGKANVMDLEFCAAITAGMVGVGHSDARAVVLTGQGAIFSAGVDLNRMLDGGVDYVARFLPALDAAFEAVFALDRPVVAAINGHAIAGGCILACAADRRLMVAGRGRIGVPELRVGVPFPPVALEIVRAAAVPPHGDRMLLGGTLYSPAQAQAIGLVEELCDADALLARAVEVALDLASIPGTNYALTKRMVQAPVWERIARQTAAFGAQATAAWQDPQTLDAVRAYVDKTLKRG